MMYKPKFLLLLLMFSCIFLSSAIADTPLNDECADADDAGTLVADSTVILSGSVNESTQDCDMSLGSEVWVKFTIAECMDVTIDFCNQSDIIYMASQVLYDGCPCSGGSYVSGQSSCENYNPEYKWTGLDAGTYYYPIEQNYFSSGSYTVSITCSTCAPPPSNDDCTDATVVGDGILDLEETMTFTGDLLGSTIDCENINTSEVWIKFTTEQCLNVVIDFCDDEIGTHSPWDQLFTDCPCGESFSYNDWNFCENDNSSLTWGYLSAGTYYYPVINIGNDEPYTVNVTGEACPTPPANDECASATDGGMLALGIPLQFTGNNEAASSDCPYDNYSEVWIKFETTTCMNVTIDYCGTSPAFGSTSDMLFTECPCEEEAIYRTGQDYCEDDNYSGVWASLPAGTYYYPVIKTSGASGDYIINVTGSECPQSDFTIIAPITVTGNTTCDAGNDCIDYSGEDHIYEITIPNDGLWEFSLCNSANPWENCYMVLSTGICNAGEQLGFNEGGCENGMPKITANLTAGTYYLLIDSYESCGEYTLEIAQVQGPCDEAYYSNGDADYQNAFTCYRSPDEYYPVADDFSLTEDVTIEEITFIGSADVIYFQYSGTSDFQILANDNGAPGEVIYEETDYPCPRTETGLTYQGITSYAYQLENLNIDLAAGTYFLAYCPVTSSDYSYYPNVCLTTAIQNGASTFIKYSSSSSWELAEPLVDLAFCLFGTTGGGDEYEYLPGDANMAAEAWPAQTIGGDVTYLVNYFRGLADPCNLDGFYASADATGDCMVVGGDVTYLVNYFRGLADMSYCSDYEPAWPTSSDVPAEAPDGWPNCD